MNMPAGARGDVAKAFREALRAGRTDLGLSQAELARRADDRGLPMIQETIAKIESGRRGVTLDEASTLLALVGRSLAELEMPNEPRERDLAKNIGHVRLWAGELEDVLIDAWRLLEELRRPLGDVPTFELRPLGQSDVDNGTDQS